VRNNGDKLSVILAGHPKLKNDLKRPTLEEIGGRTHIFALEGIRGHQEEYIQWILAQAAFMETVLAIGFDDLEPNLIRHGYNTKSIARLLNVRPAEVRSFLHGQLPPEKTQDMRELILKIGIPL
jgi:hypothetical protein